MTNYSKYGKELIEASEYISSSKGPIQRWKIIFDVLDQPAAPTFQDALDQIRRKLRDQDWFDYVSSH